MEFAFTRKNIRRRYETVVLHRLIEVRISGAILVRYGLTIKLLRREGHLGVFSRL